MRRTVVVALALVAAALAAAPASPTVPPGPPPALVETSFGTFAVGPTGWTPEVIRGPVPRLRGWSLSCGPPCVPPSGIGLMIESGTHVVGRREMVRISLFLPVASVRGRGLGGGRLTVVDAGSGRLTWQVRRKTQRAFPATLTVRTPRGDTLRYDFSFAVARRL